MENPHPPTHRNNGMLMTSLSDCEDSQHCCALSNPQRGRNRRRVFPSPSTSGTTQEGICPPSYPIAQDPPSISRSAPESPNPYWQSDYNPEFPTLRARGEKRKRLYDTKGSRKSRKKRHVKAAPASALDDLNHNETTNLEDEEVNAERKEAGDQIEEQTGGQDNAASTPVEHWARFGEWPRDFQNMPQTGSVSPKKRPQSSSYSQRTKNGEVPEAYSPEYEQELKKNGIIMGDLEGSSRVTEDSKTMCIQMLQKTHQSPQHGAFPQSLFLAVRERARMRNEARICRDITPLLVPSPELLWICGDEKLEHVFEEINKEWTKCTPLAGPIPKPDLAVGLAPSAFNEREMAKLKNHTTVERATAFTSNLYFPFLLCEVKSAEKGLGCAVRQNMHSGSMAVKAIVQLCRALEKEDELMKLNGKILVFSVSHNGDCANLYGHFAIIEGDKETFYHHLIEELPFRSDQGRGWKRTHDFVREIYSTFYPTHLKRIQDMLASMSDPQQLSIRSGISVETSNEQEQDSGIQSSEVTGGFKTPGTPPSKRQKNEMTLLREQMAEQKRDFEKRMADQQRKHEEQIKLLQQLLERLPKQ